MFWLVQVNGGSKNTTSNLQNLVTYLQRAGLNDLQLVARICYHILIFTELLTKTNFFVKIWKTLTRKHKTFFLTVLDQSYSYASLNVHLIVVNAIAGHSV